MFGESCYADMALGPPQVSRAYFRPKRFSPRPRQRNTPRGSYSIGRKLSMRVTVAIPLIAVGAMDGQARLRVQPLADYVLRSSSRVSEPSPMRRPR